MEKHKDRAFISRRSLPVSVSEDGETFSFVFVDSTEESRLGYEGVKIDIPSFAGIGKK